MKHLFIINPAAGKGKALKLVPEIQKIFSERGEDYFIEVTTKPRHAVEIVKNYLKHDHYRIYSVGGDGTLNEVINGIVTSGAHACASSLVVIPAGSGNDFMKSISKKAPVKEILHNAIDGLAVPVDVVKVNGRYSMNISSVGFDAEVAANAAWLKKLPFVFGGLSYWLGIIVTLMKYRNHLLTISIDGKEMKLKSLLVAVANGRFYGGGIQPAPDASINDGFLDICLIDQKNIFEILRFFPKYVKGKHGSLNGVSFFKARKAKINCNREIAINIDGEIIQANEVIFEVIHHGISLVMPEIDSFSKVSNL